jgi:hypothetical protein
LSKVLNAAVDADLARKNVAARMQLPQKQHCEKKVLTAEEVRRFFDTAAEAEDRFYALYIVPCSHNHAHGAFSEVSVSARRCLVG